MKPQLEGRVTIGNGRRGYLLVPKSEIDRMEVDRERMTIRNPDTQRVVDLFALENDPHRLWAWLMGGT